MSDNLSENIPCAFMWQVFHNTITTMFKNLDSAENNLRILVNTMLTSKEFAETLVPKQYNAGGSIIDRQYEEYTVWLLGRLFYLLSCEKLENSHALFVEAQVKILDILQMFCPHRQFRMVSEYSGALSELCRAWKRDGKAELRFFIPDRGVMTDLDLAPELIQVNTKAACEVLQKYVAEILSRTAFLYVASFRTDKIVVTILDDFIDCLNAKHDVKTIVVKFFGKIVAETDFAATNSRTLADYVRRVVTIIQIDRDPVTGDFLTALSSSNLISDPDVRRNCRKLCNYHINETLRQKNPENAETFLKAVSTLLRVILEESRVDYDVDGLIDYFFKTGSTFGIALIEYQMFEEVKRYVHEKNDGYMCNVDFPEASPTWVKITKRIDSGIESCLNRPSSLHPIVKFFTTLKNTLKLVQNVHFRLQRWVSDKSRSGYVDTFFFDLTDFLARIQQITNEFVENVNVDNLPLFTEIVKSLFYVLTVTDFTKQKQTEFETIVFYICYPFVGTVSFPKSDPKLSAILSSNLPDNVLLQKRIESLRMLSVALCHCNDSAWRQFFIIRQWIFNIVYYCSRDDSELLVAVTKSLPILLTGWRNEDLISEVLHPIMRMENDTVSTALMENIGVIICQTVGETSTVRMYDSDDDIVYFEVLCERCDHVAETYLMKVPKIEVKVQEATTSAILLDYLKTKDGFVKKCLIKNLPRYANHVERFGSEDSTREWLRFSVDDDDDVRGTLSSVFAQTVRSSGESNRKMCLQALVDATTKYFVQDRNVRKQETTLGLIREIGQLDGDHTLFVTVRLLLVYFILGESPISLTAVHVLNEIATAHDTTPNNIYVKYKKKYCETIAGMTKYAFVARKMSFTTSLGKVVPAFKMSINDFLTRDGHHIIPCFIPRFVASPECQPLLNEIADALMLDPSEVLSVNFAYIYSHLYLNESEKVFKSCMGYVLRVMKTNLASILRGSNMQLIHNELLTHFHDKRDLVLKAIYELAKNSSGMVISSLTNMQEFADALNPRFMPLLVYFDSKLIAKRVCDDVKKDILSSLPGILKLMGRKYITPLRHKLVVTLRTASMLDEEPYPSLLCEAWDAFVHCCEPDSLGPLLSTIFISLLPLLQQFPQKINEIFRYILVENEEKVRENIPDLFFIESTPVRNEYKNYVNKHLTAQRPGSTMEQLNVFIKILTSENKEVVLYGLQFLKKYLSEKRSELDEIILSSVGMNEVVVELIDKLVSGCRESDDKTRQASSECIGELGAIEPSHFPRKYTLPDSQFTFYISDDLFIVNALIELTRAFQMEKHTQNMNRHALAIQEILKVYGVSPESTARKFELWNNFSDNMKELMLPLLSSRYTIAMCNDKPITTHPIYGSNFGSPFKDWVYNWTNYLISIVRNDKQTLLQVCKPSLNQDYRTLMFFLPHILIHAIIECNDAQRKCIHAEFEAVLSCAGQQIEPVSFRTLKSRSFLNIPSEEASNDVSHGQYVKVVFVLLDYLDRWMLEWESKYNPKAPNAISTVHYQQIKNFTSKFCKLTIAKCNFDRDEFPRALLYIEKYIAENKTRLNEQLGFLSKIYGELEEPDGVAGAMAKKVTEPSLEEMILSHRLNGQLQDVAACYERLAQETILQPENLHEMIRCYLELENPYTAFNIAQAAMETHLDHKTMLYELQAESFWRQSSYEKLEELLAKPELKTNTSWGVLIGKTLQHFRLGERIEFRKKINEIRKTLTEMLTVTSIEEGVYQHGYSHVIKLHILNELEKAEEMVYEVNETKREQAINDLMDEWDLRLKIIQPSVRTYEPVLRLRRIILEQSQAIIQSENIRNVLDKNISKYWLKSAEIARQAGMFQQAYIYLLKAERYKSTELFIEKAKFYWAKDEKDLSFATLNRGIDEHFPDHATFKDMDSLLRRADRKLCSEAKLLIAIYNEETANVGFESNISNYKEAADMYKEWEKSLVHFAQYYDKILATMVDAEKDIKGGEIQVHIINCFGKSLQYGSNYIYQSIPRMLSIWFDYGTRIFESRTTDDASTKELKKNILIKMIHLMDTYLDRLPPYMFLTAFSQLVSRICHPLREVYLQIKAIIIKLILKYPQQSMWMIMAVSKSAYATRTKRCQEILQDQRLKNSTIMRLIYDFNRLAEKLIELCNKAAPDSTTISSLLRTLPRLLQSQDFSEIILPIQKLMKIILPNPDLANNEHDPFPNAFIYLTGIEDTVEVLSSLQRPKKITFRGSDGKKYFHMLKAKDDLRKDCRLMEFNDVVNLYLHKEAETRQRRLYLRTYSVVPLNEECGIIEWVNNLVGLRPVLINMYKQKGMHMTGKELKTMMCNVRDPPAKKKQIFLEKLLPKHPAILSEWFRRTFPDAHHWYQARTAYIRTSAAMSMVGYILGLGDRHGENILFDSTNGDVIHVDFNCLFNKGETFDWPERVPFRLTHNMIEAMGPLGVDGIFRKSCAVTLRILRMHTDVLMSIVKPFVYDPLVSWSRNTTADAEITNGQAVEHIRNIELRLQGSYKSRGKTYSVPLSWEGQANNLILEATNVDNLSQMYIGWGPFL